MQSPVMNELMRAHRSLCSRFVSEDLFRRALGGGRADISRVAAYLQIPLAHRPALSSYFDRDFYIAANPDIAAGRARPAAAFHRNRHPRVAFAASADRPALHRGGGRPGAWRDPADRCARRPAGYDLAASSPYFDPPHYLSQISKEVPRGGLLSHFLQTGLAAGRRPNAFIDPDWYGDQYPDVGATATMPSAISSAQGDIEARAAGPDFDGALLPGPLPGYRRKRHSAAAPLPVAWPARRPRRPRWTARPPRPRSPRSRSASPLPTDPEASQRAHADMKARVEAGQQRRKDAVKVKPPAPAPVRRPGARHRPAETARRSPRRACPSWSRCSTSST